MQNHIDDEWISKKINSNGGAYFYNNYNSLATIDYIGNKKGIIIFTYNVILFFKYLKRIILKYIK